MVVLIDIRSMFYNDIGREIRLRGERSVDNGPLIITTYSPISSYLSRSNFESNRETIALTAIRASINARFFPGQLVGPAEKGMEALGLCVYTFPEN